MAFAARKPSIRPGEQSRCAFTLVELLVVIGIIALLISILLPSLIAVQRQARVVRCASNIRQICSALFCYASENQGRYPPNLTVPNPGQYWCTATVIGRLLPNSVPAPDGSLGGGALVCPEDPGAQRSYAMNVWASSKIDKLLATAIPPRGSQWTSGIRQSTKMILVIEKFSTTGSEAAGWYATPFIGMYGAKPAHRFGAGGGIVPPVSSGRFGMLKCELPYQRHASRPGGSITQSRGRINIGYADGHVLLRSESELADWQTGLSTLDSLWSPMDPALNN